MADFFKKLSLVPRGLRHKLMVAFALMTIVPLLVCVYLATTYIYGYTETIWDVSLVIGITLVISLLGFALAREIVDPIIRLSFEARVIAEGDIDRKIIVEREDEIGDLERSLNLMNSKLKENMTEIQSYGERIQTINLDINKKILALSALLQVGNVMSTTLELDKVMLLVVERLLQVADTERVFLMLTDRKTDELVAKYSHNVEPEVMKRLRTKFGEGLLGRVAVKNERMVLDSSSELTKPMEEFTAELKIKNLCLIPVASRGKVVGLVGLGNNLPEYTYEKDDLELLNIFARQIAVAIENDWLVKRTKELTVRDELTGLYNEKYMRERLGEEIKRAIMYQRPCSFVVFNIDDFKKYQRDNSELAGDNVLRKVADILKESVEEIDKVARTSDDNFVIVLPERNKGEARDLAEEIRKSIEAFPFLGAKTQPLGKLTVSAGISANPIDGITAEDLIDRALIALNKAKKEGKNRVAT